MSFRSKAMLIAFASVTFASAPSFAGESELEKLATLMSGSFSSKAQATKDVEFKEVVLHVSRVWPERKDGVWLYVEQAIADTADKPYRQRVYHLERAGEGEFSSTVLELTGDPLRFAGDWKKPAPLSGISPDDLKPRPGCAVRLVKTAEDHYSGRTGETSCESKLRGASYATTEVTFSPSGMTSWDRGWDANGKQVWGSVKGAYVFDRSKE